MDTHEADIVIIGGGIAGLSLAAALKGPGRVLLLEAEPSLAYHTSSRSAAQTQPTYGPPAIREVTAAALGLLGEIEERIGRRILTPRPLIWCEFEDGGGLANLSLTVPGVVPGTVEEAVRRLPALRADVLTGAAFDEGAKQVDVAALLAHYERTAIAHGVEIVRDFRVDAAVRTGGGWIIRSGERTARAAAVVNASGAWADTTAAIFGVAPKGLVPHRRTVTVARAEGMPVQPDWPMAVDVGGGFFFRVEDGAILASPMEEDPNPAEDAVARIEDVERVKRRVNAATHLQLGDSLRSWAGLRTHPYDGIPVVGWDPDEPTFFWLAGQGGYGIQTSAALARLAAASLLRTPSGLDPATEAAFSTFSPARFDASTAR
jgi:Glycine/D-amino acid oxidases (deaminating)